MKKRESNFELLRIISMLMIIAFHCVTKSGFHFTKALSLNEFTLKSFWMIGELGVDIFMLISGYFMIKFSTRKFVSLSAQILFYCALLYGLNLILTDMKFSIGGFLNAMYPHYWFAKTYLVIYVLSPFVNKLLTSLSKKEFQKMLFICIAIWCIIPTFLGVFEGSTESMSFYDRNIWMFVIYFTGAYIRLHYSDKSDKTPWKYPVLSIILFALLILSIPVLNFAGRFINISDTYLHLPNNVVTFSLAVCIFITFSHLKIKYNKIINLLASTTFGIYLFHDGTFNKYIWNFFNTSAYASSPTLILRILFSTVCVFAVGFIVDIIRQFIDKQTIGRFFDRNVN